VDVRVTDLTGLHDQKRYTVRVVDSNKPPRFTSGVITASVRASSLAGTVVKVLPGYDPDGDLITFHALDDGTTGFFAVNETTGAVYVTSDIPQTADGTSDNLVVVAVEATPTGRTSNQALVTIEIKPYYVFEPIALEPTTQPFTVSESATVSTLVGTVPLGGVTSGAATWSFARGNERGAFSIHPTTGEIRVATTSQLDVEQHGLLVVLAAQACTTNNICHSRDVEVAITNVNDEFPVFVVDTLLENVPEGSSGVVAVVVATDPDAGDTVRYELDAPSQVFGIQGATGSVSVLANVVLDFED
jgi:hypothetical protein